MTPANLLRTAREAAGFKSASAFARAHGFTESAYRHHENGTRPLTTAAAQAYAKALGTDWRALFPPTETEETPARSRPVMQKPAKAEDVARTFEFSGRADMPRDFPVQGSASCGPDGKFVFESGTIDFIRRPPRLSGVPDAYGLYVQGDSMSPWRENGQPVYVVPRQPVQINDFVVAQLKDHEHANEAYIKRLAKRSGTEIHLLQYNPRKILVFPVRRIHSLHRIMDWGELLGI